ncbi:MAG TPA: hypothetical protein VFU31_21235 [Candidatus Binatia bacterium]|nr:hypothetical protein [Candidatus Binatia bacterium]
MQAEVKNGNLIITLPISPRPSKTGKTIVVAGTAGFAQTLATHDGKQISVSVNATIPN